MENSEQRTEPDKLRQAIADAVMQVDYAIKVSRLRDVWMEQHWTRKREASSNPLVKRGEKYFSQSDEDGILLEICRRLGLERGVFLEIGPGNGLENNSLILLMHGWRGAWLGGEPLAFEVPEDGPLFFQQAWITRENCPSFVSHVLSVLGEQQVHMFSLDLDGNDLYVLEAALESGLRPEIVIVEYNGKFPPPVRWSVKYDPQHVWDGTDYQGASLQSFADLLARFGYRLVACNLTGGNAFFVQERHAPRFADVPQSVAELFMPPDYCWFVTKGHPVSPRTIEIFLASRSGKN